MSEQLFVYGILLDDSLRLRNFMRNVHTQKAVLIDYRLGDFSKDLPYKCVYKAENNYVDGLNLTISKQELTQITDIIENTESGLYKRVIAQTDKGLSWVYVKGDNYD